MKQDDFKRFIIESNKAGYADGDLKKWINENDGSTSITFEKGPWRSHDNFFGGEPYGGRIIVSFENKPYWMMLYYGWVSIVEEIDSVFGIIRKALMEMPEKYPYRGPEEFKYEKYTYANSWSGEVDRFEGREQIRKREDLIYQAKYIGGLVDCHEGV